MSETELVLRVALGAIATQALGMGVVYLARRGGPTPQATMPVAPFFVSVTAIFSLIVAFHGATIWSRADRAELAFMHAQTSLERLIQASKHAVLDRPSLEAATRKYADLVKEREWQGRFNRDRDDAVDDALQTLRIEVIQTGVNSTPGVQNYLLHLFDDVVRSRAESLWIGAHKPNVVLWFVIFALGIMSNVAIAMVHQDRPRAAFRALIVFNITTALAYWLLLRAENPYEINALLDPARLLSRH